MTGNKPENAKIIHRPIGVNDPCNKYWSKYALTNQWRNRWGAGGRVPPETSDQEIFADVLGKKRQGKKGKGVKIEKKRRKIVKGKVENWKWK